MNETMKITVEYNPEWEESSINDKIESKIVEVATRKYLENLNETFGKKIEELIYVQAQAIVKGITKIELDQCNKNGLKEVISIEDFIVKKAIESLTVKVDSRGRNDYNSGSEKRTPVEWLVNEHLKTKNNSFANELKSQINKIEQEFQNKLKEMVNTTLAPIYQKLVNKLNS